MHVQSVGYRNVAMVARVVDDLPGQLFGLKFLDAAVVAAHMKHDRLAVEF